MSKLPRFQFSLGVLIGILTLTAVSLGFCIAFGSTGMLMSGALVLVSLLVLRNCLGYQRVMGIPLVEVTLLDLIMLIASYWILRQLDYGPMGGDPALGYVTAGLSMFYIVAVYVIKHVDGG
jgi:hypothetical protein